MNRAKKILIVDIKPFKRGGHFRYWYQLLGEVLSNKSEVTGILNDDVDTISANYFNELIKLSDDTEYLPKIESWLNRNVNNEKIIILMWAYDYKNDFEALNNLIHTQNVKIFGIAAISHALRNSVHKNAVSDDKAILEYFGKRGEKWKILVWDQFLNIKLPKNNNLLPLPDVPIDAFEEFEFDSELKTKWNSYKYKVGFIGMLFGYRGLSSIIKQHKNCKDTLFICWGTYKENMLPYFQRKTMKRALDGQIPNIYAKNNYLSDGNMSYLLSKIDYFYISSKSYPVSSGISIKAATLGTKILTDKADAALNDMITRYECGYIIDSLSSIDNNTPNFKSTKLYINDMNNWYCKKTLVEVLEDYFNL